MTRHCVNIFVTIVYSTTADGIQTAFLSGYEPAEWVPGPNLPTTSSRRVISLIQVSSQAVIALGGMVTPLPVPTFSNETYEYSLESGAWTALPNMPFIGGAFR